MSDDLAKRGGQDRTRIDVNEDNEQRDWARKFGVTPWQLKVAVQVVGDGAADVEKPLNRGGHTTPGARIARLPLRGAKAPGGHDATTRCAAQRYGFDTGACTSPGFLPLNYGGAEGPRVYLSAGAAQTGCISRRRACMASAASSSPKPTTSAVGLG